MKAKLISYSQLHEPIEGVNNIQDLIVYFARVSNPKNQNNSETNNKLIKYLLKHKHFSPFEMVNVCLEIETTRDISRQLLRHRSFSFQEFSQRYAQPFEVSKDFVVREARMQDSKNRQNSIECDSESTMLIWEQMQMNVMEEVEETYQWAIKNGIAKEQARCILPEGNTMTRLYMSGSLRSWIHYLEVRTLESTQKEHRLLAEEMAKAISEIFTLKEV